MISFACAHCGLKIKVKEQHAGKTTKCPTCKQPLTVPSLQATVPFTPPQQVDGSLSSLAKLGVDAGVTLDNNRPATGPQVLAQRSLGAALARGKPGGQRYVVEEEIGRGGMGAVLRAIDCDIRREVAVKYLLDVSEPKKKARFIEEAQITGQLEHPNIVPVYDLGIDSQRRPFLMMKLVKGRSLKEALDDLRAHEASGGRQASMARDYSLGRLLAVLVSMCHALAYAHARGVIHRDLKPANIMLGDFGEVYVMDWGLAKVLSRQGEAPGEPSAQGVAGSARASLSRTAISGASSNKVVTSRQPEGDLTQEGAVLGTPVYMAPEQALGRTDEIDAQSDVYSLGAILYEMLTLEPPVDKEGGYLSILMRVGEGEIQAPEVRTPQRVRTGKIPPELSAVAMKALARAKVDRYPSVEALRRDIERFLEGRSVSAKDDTKREMFWKFVKRNKGFSAGAAAALMVLVASLYLVGMAWWDKSKAYDSLTQAQKDTEERTRLAVPALVGSARLAGENRDLKVALDQLDLALIYSPYDLPAHRLRGQVLIAQLDFTGARAALQRYLELEPKDADAKELLRLCQTARREDGERLLQLAEILLKQKRFGLASCLLQEVAQHVKDREKLVPALSKRINAAWPGLGNHLSVQPDGSLKLNLGQQDRQVLDLTPLQGMPLNILYLSACSRVRDLAPLKGMPLHTLDLYGCNQVQDLAPLAGMPLTSLYLNGCIQVRDLSPLQGMKLTVLDLYDCNQVRDLTPLTGAPLSTLKLAKCAQVRDLSPLRGMPLTTLDLGQSNVEDVAPLQGMKLTKLQLNRCSVSDLSPLRGMPLAYLDISSCPAGDLSPLVGMPLTELAMQGSPTRDLTPLKGLRLTRLHLHSCQKVQGLEPLRGMPLTYLSLDGALEVRDLAPLRGMPLIDLNIGSVKAMDLAPLAGMPLKKLRIYYTNMDDLSPLAGLKLDELYLTPKNIKKGMEVIRTMKSLRLIAIDIMAKDHFTPEDFWKRYDAGEFK